MKLYFGKQFKVVIVIFIDVSEITFKYTKSQYPKPNLTKQKNKKKHYFFKLNYIITVLIKTASVWAVTPSSVMKVPYTGI